MEKNYNLIIPLVKQEIKHLVARGDISAAANFLLQLAQIFEPTIENEVIILKCEMSILEKKQRMGAVDSDTENIERCRLAHRLLMISISIGQA